MVVVVPSVVVVVVQSKQVVVVVVGPEQSAVQAGDVQRIKVPCDAGVVQLSEREAKQGAATTFRAIDPKAPPRKLPTLYGASPLVEAKGG